MSDSMRDAVQWTATETALGNEKMISFQVAVGTAFATYLPNILSCECEFCMALSEIVRSYE